MFILDYFPSPTRILHESQFQLLVQQYQQQQLQQQQQQQQIFALAEKQQQQRTEDDHVVATPPVASEPRPATPPQVSSTPPTPKIAPPRPPRMKKNLQKSSNCVCKSKTNVETKSVGCGTDQALKTKKQSNQRREEV